MEDQTTNIVIGVVILLAVAIMFFFYFKKKKEVHEPNKPSAPETDDLPDPRKPDKV